MMHGVIVSLKNVLPKGKALLVQTQFGMMKTAFLFIKITVRLVLLCDALNYLLKTSK